MLYASLETRIKRIKLRNVEDKDLKDADIYRIDGYKKMNLFIQRYNIPYIFINTEGKDVQEVINEIEKKNKFNE